MEKGFNRWAGLHAAREWPPRGKRRVEAVKAWMGLALLAIGASAGPEGAAAFTLEAPVLGPTPGFLYHYGAGESPDGDHDAVWENTAGTKDFELAFNNGPQTPVNVGDSTTSRISRAYAFPAARASVASTPAGFTRRFQDASFELWFRPGALTGRRLLFEIGGQAAAPRSFSTTTCCISPPSRAANTIECAPACPCRPNQPISFTRSWPPSTCSAKAGRPTARCP